jgi:membrane carboxypeptidase/penicillin-binding protein
VPELLKKTLWAYDFRGAGQPEVRPLFPFLVSIFVWGREAPASLASGVARFYGKPERQLHYTLHQVALATWISRNWSAEDAINTYASHLWLGSEVVGAEAGADSLFGKVVSNLTIGETALLVATARSPRALSPLCHPERAMDARRDVLKRMLAVRVISDTEFAAAAATRLGVRGTCQP